MGCRVYTFSDIDKNVIDEVFNASKDVMNWASTQNFTNLRPNGNGWLS